LVQFAPPVFLPVPRADGTYSHLRGQHGIVVLLDDDGTLTAVNGRGDKLWQVQ
jgi:outer membrane protein assembly factor BamB